MIRFAVDVTKKGSDNGLASENPHGHRSMMQSPAFREEEDNKEKAELNRANAKSRRSKSRWGCP